MSVLPDFGAPMGDTVFGADTPGVLVGIPRTIELTTDAVGKPSLTLERIRGVNPQQPPAAYGLVSVGLRATTPVLSDSGQPVTHRAVVRSGTVHIELTGDKQAIPVTPMPWDTSLPITWSTRVTDTTINALIAMLERDAKLPLLAIAEFIVPGLASRIPVSVRLDWDAVRSSWPVVADGTVDEPRLYSWLLSDGLASDGPITVVSGFDATHNTPDQIATALADRFRVIEPGTGVSTWDLSARQHTWRRFSIVQDLHAQLSDLDVAAHVPAGVIVPALKVGWLSIDVHDSLPANRVGILDAGIDLTAPPQPPLRYQTVSASCQLQGRALVTLPLGPNEEPIYNSQCWLIRRTSTGVVRTRGPVIPRRGYQLVVGLNDFGVRFVPVVADLNVLELGDLVAELIVHDRVEGSTTLTATSSEAVFVTDSDQAKLRLRLVRAGYPDIDLDEQEATATHVYLATLPGWGPHHVAISYQGDEPLCAIELTDLTGEQGRIFQLTPAQPTAEWNYFVSDPFQAGYRYRLRGVGEPGPWQEGHPNEPLIMGEPPMKPNHTAPQPGHISTSTAAVTPDGGYAVRIPGSSVVDVIPGAPQPEAPGGGPSFRLIEAGDYVLASMGTRWPVTETWLRTTPPSSWNLDGYRGETATIRVPIAGSPTVTVAVSPETDGEPSVIATTTTSGYPPFTAILNVPLGPDAAAAIRAAAAGERGRAWVTIAAEIPADLPIDPAVFAHTSLQLSGTAVTSTVDLADWSSATNH